jgi:hypothetical protein
VGRFPGTLQIRNTVVARSASSSTTHFLNVDLDIYSKDDLRPLVDLFGNKVIVLYVGRPRGRYEAHLEIAKSTKTADSTIRAFCKLIEALPYAGRESWNAATVRSFSIGVQAAAQPNSLDFVIQPQTVRAVSALAAQMVLTVYAPEQRSKQKRLPTRVRPPSSAAKK